MLNLTSEHLQQKNQLNCLIVEDEAQNVASLKKLLKYTCPEVNVVADAGSVSKTKDLLESSELDLDMVFLDVFLSDGLAFEAIPKIKERNLDIVFCTGYNDYTLKAFELDAAHYLMKPIDPDALKDSVERVKVRRAFRTQSKEDNPDPGKKLIIGSQEGTFVFDHDEIIHCSGDNNYSDIWLTSGKKIKVAKTLKKIVDQLEPRRQFFKIHRSFIINLDFMEKLISQDGFYVVLKNGKTLPVSRRRIKDFRNYLGRY